MAIKIGQEKIGSSVIFVDLDGVLTDFAKAATKLVGLDWLTMYCEERNPFLESSE